MKPSREDSGSTDRLSTTSSASEPPGKNISEIKTVLSHLMFHNRNDIDILSEEGTSALLRCRSYLQPL
jgi:hypothetical protein